jgi:xanthine dehydrogenase accessory factor
MWMRTLLPALQRLEATGDRAAIALVIATAGSTYRKAGAAMLLTATGLTDGAVSGGCLEADLLVRAQESVLPTGRAELVQYDTTATDEEVWGLNLGCNGRVDLLLAPAPHPLVAPLRAELAGRRRAGLLWGLSGPELGRCWLLTERGLWGAAPPDGGESALAEAYAALWTGRHALLHDGGARYFLQTLLPAPRLVIFGAGAEGPPLARGALGLGWDVTVIDQRPALLHPARWPEGVERITADAERAVRAVDLQPDDFCILMTHHFERDRQLLRDLLAGRPRYIGVLGPRARTNLLLSGLQLTPADASRIASPLGLDLGGEGPEAIALSALAELEAVRWGRSGGRLTDRTGPIATTEEVQADATERQLGL